MPQKIEVKKKNQENKPFILRVHAKSKAEDSRQRELLLGRGCPETLQHCAGSQAGRGSTGTPMNIAPAPDPGSSLQCCDRQSGLRKDLELGQ